MSKAIRPWSRSWSSLLHPFRDKSARGFGPLALGALVFAGVFFLAKAYCDRLPAMRNWPGDVRDAVMFVDVRENVYSVHGKLERADLLVVGDSRVAAAIVAPRFEQAGLGRVAFIWCGAAHFGDLVTLAENFPELPIVIAISPLSFGPEINDVMAEINRTRHVGFDPNVHPRVVKEWAEREREHLTALGKNEGLIDLALTRTMTAHREMVERNQWSTARFDADLNRWVDWKRCEYVNPIRTQLFRHRWIDAPDPRASDNKYSWVLRSNLEEQREQEAKESLARLAEIPKNRKLALVRLPIDPGLRRIEEVRAGQGWLQNLVEQTGRPFRDFGAGDYATHDGSHLVWPSAEQFSDDLARWLRDDLGW